MITLAIETSTSHGSVALLKDGEFLLNESFAAERRHTAVLFAVVERAMALTHVIDQVAVGLGPGSFAGVRIAIAAAIGLELGLGARTVGVPSAAALEVNEAAYRVIGDARREMYYFTEVHAGVCVEGPLLLAPTELAVRLDRGPELPLFAAESVSAFPHATIAFPAAAKLAALAAAGRGIVAQGDLEPIYLREPHITYPKTAHNRPRPEPPADPAGCSTKH